MWCLVRPDSQLEKMKPVVWTFWGICVANGATPTAPVALHDPRGVQGVAKAHLRGAAGSCVTRTSADLGHTWHGRPTNRGALLANSCARECPAGHQSAQMGTSRTLGVHVISRQPPRPCRSEKTSRGAGHWPTGTTHTAARWVPTKAQRPNRALCGRPGGRLGLWAGETWPGGPAGPVHCGWGQ